MNYSGYLVDDQKNKFYPKVYSEMVTACIKSNYTLISSAWEIVPLKIECQQGKNLSEQDNGILIGKNISKIKINANAFFSSVSGTNSLCRIMVTKNGSLLKRNMLRINTNYEGLSIAPFLIDVKEGDVINLQVWATQGHILEVYQTYLTIEVL